MVGVVAMMKVEWFLLLFELFRSVAGGGCEESYWRDCGECENTKDREDQVEEI